MASISSLTGSSSTSSIYGNRNVISGLASGLDTEALIENSISGYKQKIINLQKQQVKTEWKQDAYRSIISKMVGLSQKYTSYTSGTNLFSNSFFNRAVNTVATGKYADKVGATGKSANNISITSIDSVARAARYSASASGLISAASQPEALNWAEDGVTESTIAGSMSLRYGTNSLTLRFGEDDIFNTKEELAEEINKQLADQTIKSSGGAKKASEFLEAKITEDGRFVLQQKAGKDNNFYIESASDSIKENLLGGEGQIGEDTAGSVKLFAAAKDGNMTKQTSLVEHMKGRTMSFTLNGTTKTIQLGDTAKRDEDGNLLEGEEEDEAYNTFKKAVEKDGATDQEKANALKDFIQARVEEQFGKDKINVGIKEITTKDADGNNVTGYGLDIQAVMKDKDGNITNDPSEDVNNYTLTVTSSASRALGLGKNGIGNTLNTSWSLKDVLGEDMGGLTANADGKYELKINGKVLGEFDGDAKIESVMTAINNNADAGVSVNFSKLTNQFVFTTRETGADQKIEMDDGLAQKLFGKVNPEDNSTYTAGADSKFTVKINGDEKTMTRSTNVVDLDGMSVTLKGEFNSAGNPDDEITFTSTTDSDTIVDAIKSFVNDYNAMTKEIHDAYSTLPYQKSSGSFANYEPLVGDETDGYSDSELERYEEKAKQGILFGDSDLRSLYQSLTGFIQGSGVDGATLRSIGIETSYDDGLTTISLNETKLREALSADPDKVRDAFTKTTENGASSNGLMQNIKTTMDRYASTSIATPGILVSKAGTPLSSYSLQSNQLQNQMDSLETQIEKWQDKMSDRIDYYTNQFTRLEQLINQMNSQSSALAGLMGG